MPQPDLEPDAPPLPPTPSTRRLHRLGQRVWARRLTLLAGVVGTCLAVLLLQEMLVHVVEIMVRLLVRAVVWVSRSIFRFF